MNKEIKLSVKDLKISFRTDAGKVQAVRDISFDLYKGETLAIVGESGSGKSVTSKAIIGISAVNAIHEGGEILYESQDLARIPEEEMHKLRGDKIAMIFQDPLSSLNPIMRIGKQITEAMLLKNKANRKEGRLTFNTTLATLSNMIKQAVKETGNAKVSLQEIDEFIKTFDNFSIQGNKLENSYNIARTAAEEFISIVEDFVFLTEKNQEVDVVATIKLLSRKIKEIDNKYFVSRHEDALKAHIASLDEVIRVEKSKVSLVNSAKKLVGISTKRTKAEEATVNTLKKITETVREMLAEPQYNFFRIGYYVYKNPQADLSKMSADEANELAYNFITEDFMTSFIDLEKIAVQYSINKTLKNKKNAIDALENAISFFRAGNFTQAEALTLSK